VSEFIERVVLALGDLGAWGPVLFIAAYVVASVMLAPALSPSHCAAASTASRAITR